MAEVNRDMDARSVAESVLSELLALTRPILGKIEDRITALELDEAAARAIFDRLEHANAGFPLGDYTNYYTADLSPSSSPLFYVEGGQNSIYESYPQAHRDALRAKYVVPAIDGVNELADEARATFITVAGRVAVLRRLTGYGDTLDALGSALAPPWAVHPTRDEIWAGVGREVMVRLFSGLANLPRRPPFHRLLRADRNANIGTLQLLRLKLRRAVAVLQGALDELPFAQLRTEPLALPQSLTLISDRSVSIGAGTRVDQSAIGAESSHDG